MLEDLQKTSLHAVHQDLGARLVPFAGWEMPLLYSSILEEHQAVRTDAGVFDISHMGQLVFEGAAEPLLATLEQLFTNSVAKLEDSEGQYTLMLNENGGVIDDLLLYRESATRYFAVVNAAKMTEDLAWIRSHLPAEISLTDQSSGSSALALQGPNSLDFLERLDLSGEAPPRNGLARFDVPEGTIYLCRTGYTGEDGVELFLPNALAPKVFQQLIDLGVTPCGLASRDSLRLESCFPLNGSDLSPEFTPLASGLKPFVNLEKSFFGSQALHAQIEAGGPSARLAAIKYLEKGPPPRPGYPVQDIEGREVGTLTSAVPSPTLGTGIAMAYLPTALAKPGTRLNVLVRNRAVAAEVVRKPFYRRQK